MSLKTRYTKSSECKTYIKLEIYNTTRGCCLSDGIQFLTKKQKKKKQKD